MKTPMASFPLVIELLKYAVFGYYQVVFGKRIVRSLGKIGKPKGR
jgi:hypothetical protein